MKWLNYHHLYYFWTVAKEGTVTAACERLRLAQPTVSAQIRTLEKSLGHKLFRPSGRRLEMTETGRVVYRYANEIFQMGEELLQVIEGQPVGKMARLKIGIADVVPKMVVSRVLQPALTGPDAAHLVCYEGKPNELLAKLSIHELDLVLSDSPLPPDVNLRAYNHELGQCGVTVFASAKDARKYRRKFPHSLHGAPLMLPTANTSIRRRLDYWFSANEIYPRIVAEFEDSALLKAVARESNSLFTAPSAVEDEIQALYGYRIVGRLEDVKEQFYIISLERRVTHAAVAALIRDAQRVLFQAK